jgi:hypothetical protein
MKLTQMILSGLLSILIFSSRKVQKFISPAILLVKATKELSGIKEVV